MNENYYGSMPIQDDFTLPLEMVERIEVVRGPSSALYGTGAMFGVINVITSKGRTLDGGQLSVEGGSFGRKTTSMTYGREYENGWDLGLALTWGETDGEDHYFPEFDDPSTNNGIAADLDHSRNAGGLFTLSKDKFKLQLQHGSRTKAIPTASFETEFNQYSESVDEWSHLELGYEFELGAKVSVQVRGYWDDFHYDGVYPYEGPFVEFNDGNFWGVESRLNWDSSERNRLTAGVEYQDHYRVRLETFDDGEPDFLGNVPFELVSLFAQDTLQVTKKLALTVGGRLDDYSDVGSDFSPRAALVFHPGERTTLKALYGQAFRRPNHYESYYQSPTAKPNPSLSPEDIATTEIVWEQRAQ